MAQPVNIGELVVIALKAENLPDRTGNGQQDPFCIFKLGSVAKKTKTDQRGGQNPIWDDQINLPMPAGVTRLFIQVFNRQASQENLISEGHVDLHEVLRKGEHDGFFPLVLNGKRAGKIYLELTFYAGPVQMHKQPPPIRQYVNRPPPPITAPQPPIGYPGQPMPHPRPYVAAQPLHVRTSSTHHHHHPSPRPLPPTPVSQHGHHYTSLPAGQPPMRTVPYSHPPQSTPLPANAYPPRPAYPPQHPQQHIYNGNPPSQPHPYPPSSQRPQSFPAPRPHQPPPPHFQHTQSYPSRPPYPQQPPRQPGYPPY